MEKSNALNILKNAFLMERMGKSLYEKARDTASDQEVKDFFQDLANDEQQHMDILEKQFKSLMNSDKFMAGGYKDSGSVTAPDILNDTLKGKIKASAFEATAITAAIEVEKKAVDLYAKRAEETDDPKEKAMYKWLSTWETTHLKKLIALEEAFREEIWNDNSFWPF